MLVGSPSCDPAARGSLQKALLNEEGLVEILEGAAIFATIRAEFEGFRIAQLSDIHVGSLFPEQRLARWVASPFVRGPAT